jgi:hypothetical protein
MSKFKFMILSKWFDSNPYFIKPNKIIDVKHISYKVIRDKKIKDVKNIIVNEINMTREIDTYRSSIEDSIRGMIYDRLYSGDK